MKITHLATYDLAGGAARAAYRLHRGLIATGRESRMLVLYKTSSDPTIASFAVPRDLSARVRRGLRRWRLERTARTAEWPSGTVFSTDLSQHGADVLGQIAQADILNLHWIAGFFDYGEFFCGLPPRMPVVWTLHDMNPFTGGCHYDAGCGKFQASCGACPQLSSRDPQDLSAQIWQRKRAALSSRSGGRLHIVAPSRWLAKEAGNSALFSGLPVSVIPYGVDVEQFQPRSRGLARQKYGIPAHSKTVLFVAHSAAERRKGLTVLLEALQGLQRHEDLVFLAVGRDLSNKHLDSRFKTIEFVDDQTELSFVYATADVFVVPSLEDNLPNTTLEALACGIPTVGSRVGGIPDVVRDGETGILVPAGDSQALTEAIAALLTDPERRASMSRESRRVASRDFSLEAQANRYAALYATMLDPVPA